MHSVCYVVGRTPLQAGLAGLFLCVLGGFSVAHAETYRTELPGHIIEELDDSCDEAWVGDFSPESCEDATCRGCDRCSNRGIFPNDEPPGVLQQWFAERYGLGGCWTAEVDAVLFWRNSPPSRELVRSVPTAGGAVVSALNADQFNSEVTSGPRFSLVRKNDHGIGAEFVYLSAGSFRSERGLLDITGFQYEPANIFRNSTQTFRQGSAVLGSGFQTFEANSLTPVGQGYFSFISGFRWFEWNESFVMNTSLGPNTYDYSSRVINSLYGGQIGVDALLLTMPWLKINSWIKGGAFYNTAVQHTSYASNVPGENTFQNAISGTPAAGAFVGEVGINGKVPLSAHMSFRFGYNAYWLEGVALATQQLTDQHALVTNGGAILQGITVGLEGNW